MNKLIHTRTTLAAFIVAVGLSTTSTALSQEPLSVMTASGSVVGASSDGIESWQGMPYAAPPIGPLRWRPPQSASSWDRPLKANALASSCAQNADLGVFARAGGSEDCLYLNVYRSIDESRGGNQKPVFVWIHGGALQVGQGGDYDPTKLAKEGGAVVVTFNYRLGVLGFLSHPDLDGEGHEFGNYGLMDQQAALRWVQQNIEKFGGDPTNVTIAGESSGGNSVMAHIASPGSKGLFQHVIAMSGGGIMARHPAFGAPRPLEVARESGKGFAEAAGCETGVAQCLRSLSTKQVLDTQTPYMLNEFVIDGKVLPVHPADAYRTGAINQVTLVSGSTRDEGRFFLALPELATDKALTDEDYPEQINRQYGAQLSPEVLKQYPLENYDNASEAFAAALTDSMFACPGLAMNRTLADKMPVYAYEFADRTAPSYVDPTSFPLLAAHTYELAYVFPGFKGGGNAVVTLNPLQEKLSKEMVGYFSNLSGISSKEAAWPRFDPAKNNILSFELPQARMVSGRFADAHHCGFWDKTGSY